MLLSPPFQSAAGFTTLLPGTRYVALVKTLQQRHPLGIMDVTACSSGSLILVFARDAARWVCSTLRYSTSNNTKYCCSMILPVASLPLFAFEAKGPLGAPACSPTRIISAGEEAHALSPHTTAVHDMITPPPPALYLSRPRSAAGSNTSSASRTFSQPTSAWS